jgi:glutathione S-transferase
MMIIPKFLPSLILLLPLLSFSNAISSSSVTKPARFITNKMCPFAQKAWIALEASNADFSLEQLSLYGAGGKPDWFWELNPQGTVPVLVVAGDCDEDVVLPDSDLILNDIAQVPGGETLIPTDPESVESMKKFRKCLSEFLAIGKKAVLGGSKGPMWNKLKELDALVVGPYVCGDDVTVADCAGFPFLWRIENEYGNLSEKNCPNLAKWLQTCKQNPAFSKTVQSSWWWWW